MEWKDAKKILKREENCNSPKETENAAYIKAATAHVFKPTKNSKAPFPKGKEGKKVVCVDSEEAHKLIKYRKRHRNNTNFETFESRAGEHTIKSLANVCQVDPKVLVCIFGKKTIVIEDFDQPISKSQYSVIKSYIQKRIELLKREKRLTEKPNTLLNDSSSLSYNCPTRPITNRKSAGGRIFLKG